MRDTPMKLGNDGNAFPKRISPNKAFILKRIVSSTPPLCRRGGWGVRLLNKYYYENITLQIQDKTDLVRTFLLMFLRLW